MISPSIFREYDIRGIYEKDLHAQSVKLIGYFLGHRIGGRKCVAIGYDARTHSPQLRDYFTSGLNAAGCSVFDMGMVPTPVNYFANYQEAFDLDGSVMITGSHNPPEYNGCKITLDKTPFFGEDIYALGKEVIEYADMSIPDNPRSETIDVKTPYIDFMLREFAHLKGMPQKIVADCGNGAAGIVLEDIFKGLELHYKGLYCEPDGTFPNHHPDPAEEANLADLKEALSETSPSEQMIHIKQEAMLMIPSDSIHYAVMEKSDSVKVVPSDINWSDLGSFNALYEELPKDKNGNTKNAHHISIDSKNNLIMTYGKKIATIDIEDLIIIDTADALLISKKGSSQKVKQVVEKLKEKNSELTNIHTLAHRPWGTYEVLLSDKLYKIKRIVVKPGKKLSLQKHFHRKEHWIVVSGTATVTVGDEVKLIRPNESTYIKMGEIHRLENQGKIPVVLIEAQVGEYTGEDDIIRIEDDFKRNESC